MSVLLIVAILGGCGPSILTVRGEHDALRVRIQQAKGVGAMVCAPHDLARAQAAWRFGTLELDQADAARAHDHLARGIVAADAAFSAGQACGVRAPGANNDPDVGLDADGDGVVGALDLCPYELEDRDRFRDEDGCPDSDNDGDGLLDAQDRCPLEPEDRDGRKDEDGCPDPDDDGDGVPDSADRCPEKMETPNGFDDADGCPDFSFELIAITGDRVVLPKPLSFEDGSSTIPQGSTPALKELGQWLAYEGGLRLRVEVHTDSKGEPAVLKLLTQSRADTIREFLAAQGVAATRVETMGWGMEKPLATNRTEAGRSQNRRVDLTVLPPAP